MHNTLGEFLLLCLLHLKVPYQPLYNLVDSFGYGNRGSAKTKPFLMDVCERQVQTLVAQWAPDSYLVIVDL